MAQPAFEMADPLERCRFLNEVEAGDGDGAGQRVRRERMAVKKSLRAILAEERLVHPLGGGRRSEGHEERGRLGRSGARVPHGARTR